jgi:hypothetical protein
MEGTINEAMTLPKYHGAPEICDYSKSLCTDGHSLEILALRRREDIFNKPRDSTDRLGPGKKERNWELEAKGEKYFI